MELSTGEMIASVSGETSPQGASPGAEGTQQQAPAPSNEHEYEVKGKKIREPLDMILKRASAGYHYAQQMEAYNKEKAAWEQQKAQWDEERKAYDPFKEMETYGRQNPQWTEHWKRAYEMRHAPIPNQQGEAPVDGQFDIAGHPIVKSLEERISKYEQRFQDMDHKEQQARIAQEDNTYRQAVESVKKEWPTIDFDQADEEGRSLEYRILQHARHNGISNFRSAFRDFYFDQLAAKKAEKAKEEVVSAKVADKRQGIIARGSASNPVARIDHGKMSWEDLATAGKREVMGR
jgi:vacuolar-type H+-ATPase subunit I/STV1